MIHHALHLTRHEAAQGIVVLPRLPQEMGDLKSWSVIPIAGFLELKTIPWYAGTRFQQQSVYCVTTVSGGSTDCQRPFRPRYMVKSDEVPTELGHALTTITGRKCYPILLMVLAARDITGCLTKFLTERDHSFNTNIRRKFLSSFVSHRGWNEHIAFRSAQTDCRMPADWRSKIISTLSQSFSVTHGWLVVVPGDGSHMQATCPHVFDSGCLVYRSSTPTAAVLHQACRHFLAHLVAVKDCVVTASVLCCHTHSSKSGMHEKLVEILVSQSSSRWQRKRALVFLFAASMENLWPHLWATRRWISTLMQYPRQSGSCHGISLQAHVRMRGLCARAIGVPERTTVRWLRHPAEFRTMWRFLDFSPLPVDMNVRGVWVQATMCLAACGSPSSSTPQSRSTGWTDRQCLHVYQFGESHSRAASMTVRLFADVLRNGHAGVPCTQQFVE